MTAEAWAALVNGGSAVAVIAVVVIFLRAIKERDADWRDYFNGLRQADSTTAKSIVEIVDKLCTRIEALENKFDQHDATEMEFLRGVIARLERPAGQERKTIPRKNSGQQ